MKGSGVNSSGENERMKGVHLQEAPLLMYSVLLTYYIIIVWPGAKMREWGKPTRSKGYK